MSGFVGVLNYWNSIDMDDGQLLRFSILISDYEMLRTQSASKVAIVAAHELTFIGKHIKAFI